MECIETVMNNKHISTVWMGADGALGTLTHSFENWMRWIMYFFDEFQLKNLDFGIFRPKGKL